MKKSRYFTCKNKLSKKSRLGFGELCYLLLMLYLTVVILYSYSDPSSTKKLVKPKVKKNTNDVRAYLKHINNPTIIYWTPKSKLKPLTTVKCGELLCDLRCTTSKLMLPSNSEGAYLFYASDMILTNMPLPRNPRKVIWAIQHEESPKNVMLFFHEKGLNLFNYSSTFSRHSDVPFPLHSLESFGHITSTKYFVKTERKNRALKEISPILYIQSICLTQTGRDEYVRELMKYQRIDSYGLCLNNKPVPNHLKEVNQINKYINNLYDDEVLKFMARYKFVIAIENGVCDDYVTEKFWRAVYLGVVPIYYGAPTIRDWFPNNKTALLIDEFPSPKKLSARIDMLMQNDDIYEEYLQHKTKGLISNQRIIEEYGARPYQTNVLQRNDKFLCFICEKLHQKDKTEQVVSKSHYNCSIPKPILEASTVQSKQTNYLWSQELAECKYEAEILYKKWMNA